MKCSWCRHPISMDVMDGNLRTYCAGQWWGASTQLACALNASDFVKLERVTWVTFLHKQTDRIRSERRLVQLVRLVTLVEIPDPAAIIPSDLPLKGERLEQVTEVVVMVLTDC